MAPADLATSVLVREREVTALMGGTGRVTVVLESGADVGAAEALLDLGERRLRELEGRWSRFIETSETTTMNSAGGRAVEVSPDTIALVSAMVSAWRLTDGVVNAAVLPDVIAAGYATSVLDPSAFTLVPADATAHARLADVVVDEQRSTVTLPPGLTLDPGGVGKGLAADLVAEDLIAARAIGVLVDVGGDLRVAGTAPTPDGWYIDIADPHVAGGVVARAAVLDGGIATSSVLRRRWLGPDGTVRHHLIGRDGRPAHHGLATSSAVVATGALAEVLAKLPLLVGEDHGLELLNHWGVPALLVRHDGTVVTSNAWSEVSA